MLSMVSTTPSLEGYRVEKYLGVVSGHVILGANVFRDWFASMRDFFGGRSRSYENVLRRAEQQALQEMVASANSAGGNAVIGVDLDFETISVKGQMLMVVATGTAVFATREPRQA